MLDVLFVNPGNSEKMYQSLAYEYRSIEPPWWAGMMASFIRDQGFVVAILDADCDNLNPSETAKKIIDFKPKFAVIVAQGCNPSASSTPKMEAVHDILDYLDEAKSGIKTVLTGLHPAALPQRTLAENEVDYICEGEGFFQIIDLLLGTDSRAIPGLWFISEGAATHTKGYQSLLEPWEMPSVAWDLLEMKKYRAPNWPCLSNPDNRSPHATIYTSLGCPYNCDFCQIKVLYNNKPGIRYRPIKDILDEIDLLVKKYGVKHLRVVDELFTVSEKRVLEVCNAIAERKYDLNMWQYARVDRVTPRMLEAMKKCGMNWAGYGIESYSNKSLNGIGKKTNTQAIDQAIKWTREAGIDTMANIIFGLPDDDMNSMEATLNMIRANLFPYVNLYTCMAYPGSKLYDDIYETHPDWLPDSWDGYSQLGYETKPLPTKYLSAKEVLKFRDSAFKSYFSGSTYQKMIIEKFGDKALEHISSLLKNDLKRKLLE